MTYLQSKLFKVQLLTQSVLIVLFYLLDIGQQEQAFFGGTFLCLVGIPHGANDHLYRQDMSKLGFIKFLSVYIGSIIFYLFVWIYAPPFALIFFFLFSFHHFGQSNFENTTIWFPPSVLWGLWILLFPVLLHFDEATRIFDEMISLSTVANDSLFLRNVSISIPSNLRIAIVAALSMLYIVSLLMYEREKIFSYLFQFILVSIWYLVTPLLFGFITVFCLWHASQSLRHQAQYFQHFFKSSIAHFVKSMLPFSLISLVGFAFYVFFVDFNVADSFVLLSLISLPHIVVMHRLYEAHKVTERTSQNII